MNRPKVSVVIPTYNGARFIRDALESVFAQTLPPQEVIVVDDASGDGTVGIAEELAKDAPIRLKVIRMPYNIGGPARPINVGAKEAHGDFISVLDQDDIFATHKLQREVTALTDNSSLSIAFGWCGDFNTRAVRQSEAMRRELQGLGSDCGAYTLVNGSLLLKRIVSEGCFHGGYPAFTCRRKLWEDKGGVDEGLRIVSDMDMLGYLFMNGNAALIREIAYYRREHESNVTLRRVEMHCESLLVRTRLFEQDHQLLEEDGLRQQLRETILCHAYWFRQASEYRASHEMYGLSARLGESRWSVLKEQLLKFQLITVFSGTNSRPDFTNGSFGISPIMRRGRKILTKTLWSRASLGKMALNIVLIPQNRCCP